jgi:hypothetical protein
MRWKYSVALLLILQTDARAALDPDEGVYRHKKLGLTLALPDGWIPSTQTGYPSILLLLLDPAGATLSLSAAALAPRVTLRDHVEENNRGLRKTGLLVLGTRAVSLGSRSVLEVTARREDGSRELRQVYLAQGSRVFVLTLCSPLPRVAALLPELHALARALELQ